MIFNSVTYVLFLAAVVAGYWGLPRRPRLWLLFVASLTFYAFWRVEYVAVMLVSAATDYFISLQLPYVDVRSRRRLLLGASLAVNLGLLLYFKYLLFFVDNAWRGLALLGVESPPPSFAIILPLGISFYTFQTLSYTIDVYRGQVRPIREFVLYGCFVTFFPQLVAGPILRSHEVTPQLATRARFRLDDLVVGARRILAGLFLKVVLADNIGAMVDVGFAQDPASLGAFDVATLAFMFGYQIYFDFSAYSHIAIGSARVMGIHFPENFDYPYISSSPKEFWGRWHISLSSWIRDYLYIPLTGGHADPRSTGGLENAARGSADRERHRTRALFITWAIMGFWHGANWTFVFWGIYHACCVWAHRKSAGLRERARDRTRVMLGWLITLPVMMLSWIPFRARDMEHALGLYGRLFHPSAYAFLGLRENTHLVAALLTVAVTLSYFIGKHVPATLERRPVLRAVTGTLSTAIMIGTVFVFLRPITQFIYFQF